MADGTKIEWTDATWNPITGCSVVSPGCTNCYAMKLAGTRLQHHPSREGLTDKTKAGPVWNGRVRMNRDWLYQPLDWTKPRRVFVCAHGDLFHENVPDDWIDEVFAVMALADKHQFQILTKRPERMFHYLMGKEYDNKDGDAFRDALIEGNAHRIYEERTGVDTSLTMPVHLPLDNVWLGVSVERQEEAVDRINHLLASPAAIRFVSAEPLLGPVDLTKIEFATMDIVGGPNTLAFADCTLDALAGTLKMVPDGGEAQEHKSDKVIDWVIVGGESGPKARPMEAGWARDLRDQCQRSGTAFFMKQMAKKAEIPQDLLIREFPNA